MIRCLLIFIFLCMVLDIYTQIVTVRDKETNLPLELAILVNQNNSLFVTTNIEGQANVSAFDESDSIKIQLIGYRSTVLSYQKLKISEFKVFLNPSDISLDQVVVSANRWSQTKQDVPSKVTSISPAEVALQNVQTAADLLAVSGEVFIQKSQLGGGSPMIRGFSANRLLYTIDGVRMNTAIFRSGNLQNVISLDPFAIENTEILFGPGSVIYGSDAIGAVMSFKTLKPQLSLFSKPLIKARAVARYSTAAREKTGHFNLNLGWKKWGLTSSITVSDFDDLQMGEHGPESYLNHIYMKRQGTRDVILNNDDPRRQTPTGYGQVNLMQKVLFKPNERWEFQYGFHYSTTSDIPRYDRYIRLHKGEPRSAEWNYGPQNWMMNHFAVHHISDHSFFDQLSFRVAQQYFEESRVDRDYGHDIRNHRIEKVNAYSGNLDFTKDLSDKTKLFYGFEVVINDVGSSGSETNILTRVSSPGPSRYPMSKWSSYALYASFQYELLESLSFQGGLRYNQFALKADFSDNLPYYPLPFVESEMNNGAVTGSLGLVYHPTEEWSLSTHFSTGFRAPNIDDMGKIFDSEPGSVVVPNPNLEAEYAYNGEVGIAKVFGEVVKLDITAFYTILNNALVRRDYTLNGKDSINYHGEMSQVQAVQNAASTSVYGIQAGVEVKLPAGFNFSTHYNWQKGEEELDDGTVSASRHAAPAFGVTRLTYREGKLILETYLTFHSEISYDNLPEEERGKAYLYAQDGDGNPFSPSWYTLNLKGAYQLTDMLGIQAGVENLTNQRYRPYSSGIVSPGINFIVSLKATI